MGWSAMGREHSPAALAWKSQGPKKERALPSHMAPLPIQLWHCQPCLSPQDPWVQQPPMPMPTISRRQASPIRIRMIPSSPRHARIYALSLIRFPAATPAIRPKNVASPTESPLA